MKKRTFVFALLIALGTMWVFSSTTSCQNQNKSAEAAQEDLDRAGENLKDAAQDAGEALRTERDELAEQMRQQGRELDEAIAELDQKIERATEKEKVRWIERRNALEQDRQELNKDLNRIGDNIGEGWGEFKNSVAYRMERIADNLKTKD